MKNGKYIQYSRIFHTFAWVKISRRISLPHYAVLPYIKKGEATSLQLPFMEIAYCPFVSKE